MFIILRVEVEKNEFFSCCKQIWLSVQCKSIFKISYGLFFCLKINSSNICKMNDWVNSLDMCTKGKFCSPWVLVSYFPILMVCLFMCFVASVSPLLKSTAIFCYWFTIVLGLSSLRKVLAGSIFFTYFFLIFFQHNMIFFVVSLLYT